MPTGVHRHVTGLSVASVQSIAVLAAIDGSHRAGEQRGEPGGDQEHSANCHQVDAQLYPDELAPGESRRAAEVLSSDHVPGGRTVAAARGRLFVVRGQMDDVVDRKARVPAPAAAVDMRAQYGQQDDEE